MRTLLVLYIHELKKIRKVVLFLLLLYGGSIFILYRKSPVKEYNFIAVVFFLVIVGCVWTGPITFAFSLNDDFKSKKLYQLHSLPVHRYTLMFSRYLAALTICILTTVGTVVFILFQQSIIPPHISIESFVIMVFSSLSWSLGVVFAVAVAMLSFRRFRSIIGVATFISLLYLSIKIVRFISPSINKISIYFRTSGVNGSYPVWIILGFIFVFLGLVFFEKYGEA